MPSARLATEKLLIGKSLVVCMGSLYCCIVACTHLGNGTGHRTVTMAAPLLLPSGLVRYYAMLHSCGTSRMMGGGWVGTDM